MSEYREGGMSENQDGEPEVFPAELVEIVPASGWQFQEEPAPPAVRRRRIRIPLLLFIATCLSTLMAGTDDLYLRHAWTDAIIQGLKYAVPLMTILVCHEMGHFVQAWRNGVYASFPYFIPMPFSPIGTMGAVIAMEARMGHRRALFDIGITGPLAGLVPTIVCCVVGIYWSVPVAGKGPFGDPLLFKILMYVHGHTHPARTRFAIASLGLCRLGRAADYQFEFDSHRPTRRRARAVCPA